MFHKQIQTSHKIKDNLPLKQKPYMHNVQKHKRVFTAHRGTTYQQITSNLVCRQKVLSIYVALFWLTVQGHTYNALICLSEKQRCDLHLHTYFMHVFELAYMPFIKKTLTLM